MKLTDKQIGDLRIAITYAIRDQQELISAYTIRGKVIDKKVVREIKQQIQRWNKLSRLLTYEFNRPKNPEAPV